MRAPDRRPVRRKPYRVALVNGRFGYTRGLVPAMELAVELLKLDGEERHEFLAASSDAWRAHWGVTIEPITEEKARSVNVDARIAARGAKP